MPTIVTHAAVPLCLGLGVGSRIISPRLLLAGVVIALSTLATFGRHIQIDQPLHQTPFYHPKENLWFPEPHLLHRHIHQFLYFDTLHLENQMKLVHRFQRLSKLNYLHFYLLNIAHFHFYGRRNFCQIKKRNPLCLPYHCSCITNLTLAKEGGVNFFNSALSCIDNLSSIC